MIYLFDGTFDGFLTAVYKAVGSHEPMDAIRDSMEQATFLPVTQVDTDAFMAGRVRTFLATRVGDDLPEWVRYAFLSADPDRFTYIARTLALARQYGSRVIDLLDEGVLGFRHCYREAMSETHRFTGLTRFAQLQGGMLYAVILPKHNVLPPLMAHFARRYPRERIAVYDEGRRLLGLSESGDVRLDEVTMAPILPTGDEQACRKLWRAFFESVAIKERLNPNLQRQHMPKYTWRNLVEMQDDGNLAGAESAVSALQEPQGRAIIPL